MVRTLRNAAVAFICGASLGAFADALFAPKFVESFLDSYSAKEKSDINLDLRNIKETVFKDITTQNLLYVATAGSPLSRKSTTFEHFLKKDERGKNLAYIDPDTRSLFFMINTYHAQSLNYGTLKEFENFGQAKTKAYEKWRAASNYIAYTLLEEAVKNSTGIAHGSTSTAPQVSQLYEKLKKRQYRIELLLCGTTDEAKRQAYKERNEVQHNIQTTEEDIINKGKFFFERIPTYFAYADLLYIHYTESLNDDYQAAAIIDMQKKKVEVRNEAKYQKFVADYEKNRKPNDPTWQALLF